MEYESIFEKPEPDIFYLRLACQKGG
jgi:hypothetical protein